MPLSYAILKPHRVLYLRWQGEVTPSEVAQLRAAVRGDPDFDPSFAELMDLRSGRLSSLSTAELRHLSADTLYAPGVMRALVTASAMEFSVSQMYAGFIEQHGHDVRVYRSMKDACRWLGVPVEALPGD